MSDTGKTYLPTERSRVRRAPKRAVYDRATEAEASSLFAGTASRTNEFGQPIGTPVAGWKSPPAPRRSFQKGQYCQLEPLCEDTHGRSLFDAFAADVRGVNWTYMPYGPFTAYADFSRWLGWACEATDPLFFAIVDSATGRAAGFAAYLNIDTANGSIEVGHIHYSEELKQTRAATEAMYLMMRQAFDLGYRRYEWKCDALNGPSRAAARRLGSASRVCSATPWSTMAAPGIPPGIRSSIASGRAWTPPFVPGWPRKTSRPTAASARV